MKDLDKIKRVVIIVLTFYTNDLIIYSNLSNKEEHAMERGHSIQSYKDAE